MNHERQKLCWPGPTLLLIILLLGALAIAGCTGSAAEPESAASPDPNEDEPTLSLPQLEAVELNGRPPRVIATTDVIGDVVGAIGGDQINLTTLMAPGQDPHSYEPSTGDLAAVARADLIFVNGWDLEEALLETLEQTSEHGPLVPISAGVSPLGAGAEHVHQEGGNHARANEHDHEDEHEAEHEEEAAHDHGAVDPHVWLDPHNVIQWVENVVVVLSELDPANDVAYQNNADAYVAQLEDLIAYMEVQTAQIPPERRKLVVTHDSLGYFARRFGFDIVGAVIPGSSTLAEPSAGELANLIAAMEEAGVCTVFVESTLNRELAETVAGELGACDEVHIVELYTGSLGPEGSLAGSYLGMMRANVDAIVRGLTN